LRGMHYQQEQQGIGNPRGIGGKSGKIVVDHFDPQQSNFDKIIRESARITMNQNGTRPNESITSRLAKQYGVSEATIRRDAKYAEAVDAIASATSPQIRWQILSADSKLTKLATLKLAKLAKQNPAAMPDILEAIRQAQTKTAATAVVQRYISEIEESPVDKKASPLADCDPLILKLLMLLAAGNKGNSGWATKP
jgi:hypothetical protein